MNNIDTAPRWSGRTDFFRPTTGFADLMKIVACNYELYSKAYTFVGPWIAKQTATNFMAPDKDEIRAGVGKPRPCISDSTYSRFVDAVFDFTLKSKGMKALILPNPTTHHSAQFPAGTFTITQVTEPVTLRDDRGIRRPVRTIHAIEFFGADGPVYVENIPVQPSHVKYIIIRPKLGKLGTPSVNKWEILFFKNQHAYMIEHVDSNLNPRWAGIY